MIDYKKFVENSRKWLSQYIQDNHLQSIICGVSGGIDSCVSLAIANPVCKEFNIPLIGRSLPTTTNKIEESKVAQLVGEAFCDNFITVNISEECQKLIDELELIEGEMTRLQEGNIKARIRMIYLRHLASVHKGVVLDNDNFTEWNLGFWTVGGDSPMDINLGLHYLWKTEIYELADYLLLEYYKHLSKQKYQAIKASVKLIPTDGNGVSNSDCDQFGLDNYKQVDDVLKTMYYRKPSFLSSEQFKYLQNQGIKSKILIEILKKEYLQLIDSYNKQGIDKIMTLHQNTEYKRKELPIKPTKEELGL